MARTRGRWPGGRSTATAARHRAPSGQRGYTLIELVAVVALAGILAALATFAFRSYRGAAKTSEAKETVSAIARAGAAAYERARTASPAGVANGPATAGQHALCKSATSVPTTMAAIRGRTYQPSAAGGADFQTGDDDSGWVCLRFSVTEPMSYQYSYSAESGDWSGQFTTQYFVARAQGDLDDDGVYSRFLSGGQVSGGIMILQTALWVQNETE